MEVSTPANPYNGCIIKLTPKSAIDEKSFELFKLSRQQFKNEKLKDYVDKIAYVDFFTAVRI